MTDNSSSTSISRRALLGAFAATTVAAAPTYSNAFGLLRGSGDIRRIKMYSARTGERIDMIYWVDGDYIKDAVREVNHFMRDWRNDQLKDIDLRTVDIVTAAHRRLAEFGGRCGVIYKSCGAGGGDLGIALALDPAALREFETGISDCGGVPLNLSISGSGAEVMLPRVPESGEGNQ